MQFQHPVMLLRLLISLLAPAAPCIAQCATSFASAVPTGGGPFQWGVVSGDFNFDGRADIAFARQLSNQVAVQLADVSPGTFLPPVAYSVSASPFSIGIGDFNADGRPDLITPNSSSNNVSVLFGASGSPGEFHPAASFAVGPSPQNLLVHDLNADGRDDFLTANDAGANITIRLAVATGGFAPAIDHAVGDNPFGLAAADFNGDGLPDLAVALLDSPTIKLLRNTGSGMFVPAGTITAGSFILSLAAADVNLDSKPDLLIGDTSDGLFVRLSDGVPAMTFSPAVQYQAIAFPICMAVGDFNRDRRPDVAIASFTTGTTAVLPGNGTTAATFQPPAMHVVAANPNGIAIADFSADGKPDLIISSQGGAANTTRLLTNTSSACVADFDCSGGTPTLQDLFDFLAVFFAGGLRADIDSSGMVGIQDVFDFLDAYFTGC